MKYGIISLAAGIVILLASLLGDIEALRILATVLLLGGAITIGISASRSPQAAISLKRIAAVFSRTVASLVAAVLVVPVLVVWVGALVRAADRLHGSNNNDSVLVVGALIAALLVIISVAALIVGIAAIRGKKSPPSKAA